MTRSTKRTIAALQSLHQSIPGVASAPTTYPASINSADLPLVLVWPAEGEWSQGAMNAQRRLDRTYRVQVFVSALGQQELDEALQASIDLLDAFGEAYLNPDNFTLLNGAVQATIKTGVGDIADGGVAVLAYAGTEYQGFEYRLTVYEKY